MDSRLLTFCRRTGEIEPHRHLAVDHEFRLEKKGVGKKTINYKLRDWVFSRQRYWGEPIPLIREKDGTITALSEKDLPKYILVSDFEKFKLYDIEENTEEIFSLKELSKKTHLFGFLAGYKKQKYKQEDEVNIKAAEIMGKLYDGTVANSP